MWLIFLFSTSISAFDFPDAHIQKESNGLVFDFVESNSNFSVDPCTDFAAHMCPDRGMAFRDRIENEYKRIWKIQETNNHRLKHIWLENSIKEFEMRLEVQEMADLLRDSKLLNDFCLSSLEGDTAIYNIAKMIDNRNDPKIRLNSTCAQRQIFIRNHPIEEDQLFKTYNAIIRGAIGIAVHEYIQNETERFHQLFFDIKYEFIELLKATPWAMNKKATKSYISKLDEVTINDFGTLSKSLEEAILEYNRYFKLCSLKYNEKQKILCKISALHIANEIMMENPLFPSAFFIESATDSPDNIYNADDGTIFFGNYAELLIYSDMVPAFYGLLGFLMSHELMHTFTFDEKDPSDGLKNLWTQEASCITQQTVKTCRNYDVPCGDSKQTFEEDAADFNGIRLAWQVYQKNKRAIREKTGRFELQRKKVLKNAFEINDDQLFFYAAGLYFCAGKSHNSYTLRQLQKSSHSLYYVRINNIASQMDEFHEAFKCQKSDRMVRNKQSDCVQYGSLAPERKMAKVASRTYFPLRP